MGFIPTPAGKNYTINLDWDLIIQGTQWHEGCLELGRGRVGHQDRTRELRERVFLGSWADEQFPTAGDSIQLHDVLV